MATWLKFSRRDGAGTDGLAVDFFLETVRTVSSNKDIRTMDLRLSIFDLLSAAFSVRYR